MSGWGVSKINPGRGDGGQRSGAAHFYGRPSQDIGVAAGSM